MEGEIVNEAASFDWQAIITGITDNILLPIITIIGSTVLLVLRSYIKRLTTSIVAKNEAEVLEKKFNVKTHMVAELQLIVESAVASNMQLANKLKENGRKLEEEDIVKLNESARRLIMAALPSTDADTEGEGSFLNVMGGQESLDALIDSLMEKYVYEYKLRQVDPSFISTKPLVDRLEEERAERERKRSKICETFTSSVK